jgi:hypothetical protein
MIRNVLELNLRLRRYNGQLFGIKLNAAVFR